MLGPSANVGENKGKVTFCTWNVKGVNESAKRGKVLSHLKSLKADVIFLQETHLKNDCHNKLKSRWINQVFHSTFSAKARGVAILVRKGVPFRQTSTIADKNGRYILVTGELHANPVVLLNLYGPNFDDSEFFRKVFSLIPDSPDANLIIGGDLNLVLDPYLDKSSTRKITHCKASDLIKTFMKNSNMCDIWRTLNPTGREYSFYSQVHSVYTRIDNFIADARILPNVCTAKYHNIIISDHCPVTFTFKVCNSTKSERNWRFEPQLLNNPKFQQYLQSQTTLFFETNDKNDVSPCLLWETYKAFIRGCIISFQASQKKRNKEEQVKLERQIEKLESENAQMPSADKYNAICALKYKLNQILSSNISRAFTYMKQKHFEFGDKPHKLLARQLKQLESDRTIYKIKSAEGTILTSHKDINSSFKNFYESLYTSCMSARPNEMQNFLDKCDLPVLSQEDGKLLNAKITCEEISKAISSLKNGKSPGPDGLSNEFYKSLRFKLIPYLFKMYNKAYEEESLPPTLNEAVITVLPKKGKDLEQVASYRPISLLNSDQKILTKILAKRLSSVINKLVHNDQTGFVPGRCSLHNLRRLCNIIYSSKIQEDLVVLSLDAEKAFDQVEWPYLFAVLEKFQLGKKFISWIKLLYKKPVAKILTNQTLSTQFTLSRGTRQGCVLSPLLFALALEPLAETIRKHPQIHGYNTAYTTNKISLYADDILLYISQPQTSIPAILSVINDFSSFAGYRINWEKSELLPIKQRNHNWLSAVPFKVAPEKITYLGIIVTKKYSSLLKENFNPLMEKLKNNIQFWKTLPISLIGRVNAIKMVFLPQYLYLLQNLPVFITKSFFKKLDSIVMPFIWNYKSHRIKKEHLTKHKSIGGLSLPNFMYYYWATNLRIISLLLDDTALLPKGLQMEREDCLPYSVGAILLSPTPLASTLYNNNPVIKSTIKILKQMIKNFKLKTLSLCIPISSNPSFQPSCVDGAFNVWRDFGICTLNDLYSNDIFMTFQQVQERFGLPNSNFFRYLQIRNYVQSHLSQFQIAKPDVLDKCLSESSRYQNNISVIYNSLQEVSNPSTAHIKGEWEKELGSPIDDKIWQQALSNIKDTSINARHYLIQYKIVHRLHYSREKIHKIYPESSPLCEKCMINRGTLLHSYALCPKLQRFWSDIFTCMGSVLKKKITQNLILIVFGFTQNMDITGYAERCFISYGLITAKKLILQFWKGKDIPSLNMWLTELVNTLHLEKIRYAVHDKMTEFEKIWQPLITFLGDH